MNKYIDGYINGEYQVELTNHAKERAVERLRSLGIKLNDEKCIELAQAGVNEALTNKFMFKYIDNYMSHKYSDADVLINDEVNKMAYVINLKPQQDRIVVKTIGETRKNERWKGYRYMNERKCWIYKDAFVFTTANGNITWV